MFSLNNPKYHLLYSKCIYFGNKMHKNAEICPNILIFSHLKLGKACATNCLISDKRNYHLAYNWTTSKRINARTPHKIRKQYNQKYSSALAHFFFFSKLSTLSTFPPTVQSSRAQTRVNLKQHFFFFVIES